MRKSKATKHSSTANTGASTKRQKRRAVDATVEAYYHEGLIDLWFDGADGLTIGAHMSPASATGLVMKLLRALEEAHRKSALARAIEARAASIDAEPGGVTIGPSDEGTKDEGVEFSLGSRLFACTVLPLERAENLAFEILGLTREMRRMPRRPMGAPVRAEAAARSADVQSVASADTDAPAAPAIAEIAPRTPPNSLNGAHGFGVTDGFNFNVPADHS